ncbi:MAG: alpha/beta hydrolase [Hyphomicrobiaceae bacterium]
MASQNNRPWQAQVSDFFAERNVSIERGVLFGPHSRHQLDLYAPPVSREAYQRPILLFLYGGGWTSGERACYSFVGSAFAARGITTVIPDYRLYPQVRYPEFNHDATLAYRWIARNLMNGTPRPVILMGHSAGAHIATTIAYDASYLQVPESGLPRASGVIALSGPYAFDPTTWPTTEQIFATAPDPHTPRPIFHVDSRSPSTLLIYGLRDTVVQPENARELQSKLQACGVAARLLEYRNLGHIGPITTLLRFSRWRAPVLRECLAFIGEVAAAWEAEPHPIQSKML